MHLYCQLIKEINRLKKTPKIGLNLCFLYLWQVTLERYPYIVIRWRKCFLYLAHFQCRCLWFALSIKISFLSLLSQFTVKTKMEAFSYIDYKTHGTTDLYYRPQRSCGQGNIFTLVCHSFCSQGAGGSASVHAGIPPPPREQTPPPDQTPPNQTLPPD